MEKFIPRAARQKDLSNEKKFNNVFVKNFGFKMDKEDLEKLFGQFGEIISCVVMKKKETDESRGFGFVCFKDFKDAEKAVAKMNGHVLESNGLILTVNRAQKKSERNAELRRDYELIKIKRMRLYQGVNLYVKNLDDTMTDVELRELFEPFGSIASVKVIFFFNFLLCKIFRSCSLKRINAPRALDLFALRSPMMLLRLSLSLTTK